MRYRECLGAATNDNGAESETDSSDCEAANPEEENDPPFKSTTRMR